MKTNVDRSVMELAEFWMNESRGTFPPDKFEDLTKLLASDLQSTLEDFVNPEYLDITLRHLERMTCR